MSVTSFKRLIIFQFSTYSIGLPSPPIEGLLSLCAISLLHKDKQLGELVIKELRKFEKDPTHGHHVAFLIAQFYVQNVSKFTRPSKQLLMFFSFQTTKAEAISYTMSRIHEYPNRPLLRKVLADLLIDTYKEEDKLMICASRMAQSSLILRYISKQGISSKEAAKALAVASIAMESVDRNQAKLLAQKAVHINPMFRNILKIC